MRKKESQYCLLSTLTLTPPTSASLFNCMQYPRYGGGPQVDNLDYLARCVVPLRSSPLSLSRLVFLALALAHKHTKMKVFTRRGSSIGDVGFNPHSVSLTLHRRTSSAKPNSNTDAPACSRGPDLLLRILVSGPENLRGYVGDSGFDVGYRRGLRYKLC